MIEREKQRTDQQKKHANEKERQAHPKKDTVAKTQGHAGADTDPQTMKDKGYVKRIEEKTEKH
jgi:hypothetical protein